METIVHRRLKYDEFDDDCVDDLNQSKLEELAPLVCSTPWCLALQGALKQVISVISKIY